MSLLHFTFIFFFFNDTATTEIYTLSLHDALPICQNHPRPAKLLQFRHHIAGVRINVMMRPKFFGQRFLVLSSAQRDRKSTRLNSSHSQISYAVFCLKKKKTNKL